ncbi:MAG: carbohydrate kinase [Nitrospirota bacterium]|nr:carbohydrate kinase [Nitrospirota bacterium]
MEFSEGASNHPLSPPAAEVVLIGEVLFDRFPDGDRLGGAPFNVAWHLAGLGATTLFISRIGKDPPGERILAAMRSRHMDTRGIQTDPAHPTGSVRITLDRHGGHDFTILPDQAYDHIDGATTGALLASHPSRLFGFGTLALRSPASRAAILNAARACNGPRFLDVNLRRDCWNRDSVTAALEHASVVKLNDGELEVLGAELDLPGSATAWGPALRERFGLDAVCVTAAEHGAWWHDAAGGLHVPAAPVTVVDTVGAGDAFSAVLILGLLRRWPPRVTIERAATLAAAMCGQRGACPDSADFYLPFLARWSEDGPQTPGGTPG